ncbi:MAG TPA: family 43 glycosylhydrolase [Bryobacteraceae bacterium]|jgi:beta-xylosidase|nr:family 43 glycosylhydrolase [Bryobacteraceae bacterium]
MIQTRTSALIVFVGLLAIAGNPVLPGDHPDPSIMRVGNVYWAANTSAEWAPIYPLFRSTDLKRWQPEGAVFETPPEWAVANFWAPELTNDRGHIRVYYAARKRGGPMCVGVATAEAPQGPYTDHGPMVCQSVGSIDPSFVRDTQGVPYLVWKEDGNSQNKPTIIYAQQTTEDGLKLAGEPHELIRNDLAWEGKVVEGPDIIRHAGMFYLFYAGGACCGRKCDYAVGVARAPHLLGPWHKDLANPIVAADNQWVCPGHGTVVETPKGQDYFMYHAYSRSESVYVGRESLLDRVDWKPDGWPEINGGHGPTGKSELSHAYSIDDDFREAQLRATWEWPIDDRPEVQDASGVLTLAPNPAHAVDPLGAILAMSVQALPFTAHVRLKTAGMQSGELAGIAIIGDRNNAAGLGVRGGRLEAWRRDRGKLQTLATSALPGSGAIDLRVQSNETVSIKFDYSTDGKNWTELGKPINVSTLPPWDRGLRVGFTCGDAAGASAQFGSFEMNVGK